MSCDLGYQIDYGCVQVNPSPSRTIEMATSRSVLALYRLLPVRRCGFQQAASVLRGRALKDPHVLRQVYGFIRPCTRRRLCELCSLSHNIFSKAQALSTTVTGANEPSRGVPYTSCLEEARHGVESTVVLPAYRVMDGEGKVIDPAEDPMVSA